MKTLIYSFLVLFLFVTIAGLSAFYWNNTLLTVIYSALCLLPLWVISKFLTFRQELQKVLKSLTLNAGPMPVEIFYYSQQGRYTKHSRVNAYQPLGQSRFIFLNDYEAVEAIAFTVINDTPETGTFWYTPTLTTIG